MFYRKRLFSREKSLQWSQLLQDSILFSLLYSIIPDAHVREMLKYRLIKSRQGKYNTTAYLTEAENISPTVSDQRQE